jgi:two-component system, chemotaxis family, response regulator Rcp1
MLTGRRCHILDITDSDADHRLMLEATNRSDTFLVDRARTAGGALAQLRSASRSSRPNLILMPWILSGSTCEELLMEIKADVILKTIPVIVFTGNIPSMTTERIYSLGASCVIEKTLDLDEFLNTMRLLHAFWATVARLPFCDPGKLKSDW